MLEFITLHYWEIGLFFFIYFALVNLIYAVLMIMGSYHTFKRISQVEQEDVVNIIKSNSLPEITFIVPVYNEKDKIYRCIENLLSITYRYKKIIVVNDGSDDGTFEMLLEKYALEPFPLHYEQTIPSKLVRGVYRSKIHLELTLIDKENGTKFDALNAGLNQCKTPYFVTVDADTIVDDAEFEAIIRPILMDPTTIGIGAGVRILNGCFLSYHKISTEKFPQSYFSSMQAIEYLRSFLMRQGWNYTGGNFCIAGAFSVFSRDAVMKIGGYAPTFANDLEIVMRLHRFYRELNIPYKIIYLADPVAFTECPEKYKRLAHQRMLWHRGLLESLWFHKKIFMNKKYGAFGMFVYPVAIFAEALEPIVEIFGYGFIILGFFLGLVTWEFFLLLILISWGFSTLYSIFSLVVEEFSFRKYPSLESLLKMVGYAFVENFGYRQLTLLWRANGFIGFFTRFNEIKDDEKVLREHYNENIKREQEKLDLINKKQIE